MAQIISLPIRELLPVHSFALQSSGGDPLAAIFEALHSDWHKAPNEGLNRSGHSYFATSSMQDFEMHVIRNKAPKLAIVDYSHIEAFRNLSRAADRFPSMKKTSVILITDVAGVSTEGLNVIHRTRGVHQSSDDIIEWVSAFEIAQEHNLQVRTGVVDADDFRKALEGTTRIRQTTLDAGRHSLPPGLHK